ncbi:hypothetical protein SeMB42_g00157 [Synchytrium endobioticum]|uniref:Uncharacterized protein n=1 Tax=Synchytrium endobioticum TaxID=286115 RepID=A0A507DUL9_9FUNG|nr:hypothetical protein SeMB42_g00157 [Synchytrium endobioticum]
MYQRILVVSSGLLHRYGNWRLATSQGTAILAYGQSPMQHSPQGTAILAYGQSPMRHYKELLFLSMVNHQWSVSLGHITMMTPRC